MKALLLLAAAAAALAGPVIVAPGEVSTVRNEYNYTAARSGQIAVFARSDAQFARAKILVRQSGQAPELIDFSDGRYSDTDPQISADGASLWFVSNRPTPDAPGKHDLNIWRSHQVDGGWSAPSPVTHANSPGEELGPEVHGGVLTFNSTRKGGPGALDIWSVALDGASAPGPLGGPINTRFNEGDYTLSRNGRVALFWSDRPGGLGDGDIWMSVRQGEDDWQAPINLGPAVNGPGFDFTPSLSGDEKTLYFASIGKDQGAQGLSDIYAVEVAKLAPLASALRAKP